jgi:membrane peptidoglycan carboxypeptidase
MLELADAYAHLTTSTPAELNPILEITSSDGSILYKKEVEEKAELIPEGVKYLMRKILSDPNNRLPGRVTKFNVAGLTYALKTGTSNVKTERGNRPRDGRLAAYMPDKLILMRAGNANATPMYQNAFGGTIHADPIKQFLKGLLDNNYLSNTEMTNVETATLTISKITGNLPADNAPMELQTSTMAYVNSVPTAKDEPLTEVEYDAQCLGVASPLTPSGQLKHGYVFPSLQSFIPSQADVEDIKTFLQASASSTDTTGNLVAFSGAKVTLSPLHILTSIPQAYCENRQPMISDAITINILSPQDTRKISPKPELMYSIKSDSDLKSISASVDETQVFTKTITKNIAEELGNTILDLSAFTP